VKAATGRQDGVSRPWRVLRLFSRLNVGGPSVHVILLTEGLLARGYDTRLVVGQEAPREGNLFALAEARGIRCERLPGLGRELSVLGDLRALFALVRLVRRYRPDVVHTHTAKAGVLGRVAARLAGARVVVHTYHGHVLTGYFHPVVSAAYRFIERRLSAWSSALVTVSEAVRDDLVRLGIASRHHIRVIPLGLELAPLARVLPRGVLRRPADVPAAAPLVGIVGRLVPIKDIPTFLRAAAAVAAAQPDARFAVVGDGEAREALEAEARRLLPPDRVFFHGWKSDMGEVFGDLTVAVNASLNEGTPVALIEAMAAGVPVVATAVGGTPDLLGEGDRGLLVPAGDPERLAGAILDVLRAPEEARARAARGRDYVLAHHSSERLVADIDALYRELLAA
jgi:glycosyltransferase involved in cell wall biosynthesis